MPSILYAIPDWRSAAHYDYLRTVEPGMFAWEWIRRSPGYRTAWQGRNGHASIPAREFGMVRWEHPDLDSRRALPIWDASCERTVVGARVSGFQLPNEDKLDIRMIGCSTEMAVDAADVEHWRIDDVNGSLRLDIVEGTLLGGPVALTYDLSGLVAIVPKLAALRHLIAATVQRSVASGQVNLNRRRRWIEELRVCDALQSGATRQAIASALFGPAMKGSLWHDANECYRCRLNRLSRKVTLRLASPKNIKIMFG